jgi:hypothetical protein
MFRSLLPHLWRNHELARCGFLQYYTHTTNEKFLINLSPKLSQSHPIRAHYLTSCSEYSSQKNSFEQELELVWVYTAQLTQTSSNSSMIVVDSSNGVTNNRCCRHSCLRSWWWVGGTIPKHVEQFPDKNNCVTLHLVGYILEYYYEARTHER